MDGGERRRVVVWVAVVVGLLAAGCGADRPTRGGKTIAPEVFIDTYVELRRAARIVHDPAAWEARKREILEARGVTEEQLQAFAESRSADVVFLKALWDTIEARLQAVGSSPGG